MKPIFKHVIRIEIIYLLYCIFILHLVRKMVKKQILVYNFYGKKSLRIMARPLHMVKKSLFSKPGVMAGKCTPKVPVLVPYTIPPCTDGGTHRR